MKTIFKGNTNLYNEFIEWDYENLSDIPEVLQFDLYRIQDFLESRYNVLIVIDHDEDGWKYYIRNLLDNKNKMSWVYPGHLSHKEALKSAIKYIIEEIGNGRIRVSA